MTTLKPGDRVHVEFDGVYALDHYIAPRVDIGQRSYFVPRSAVTLLSPAKPEWADRPGTIVRCADGCAATYSSIGAWMVTTDGYIRSYEALFQDYGPLTLLYDPAADHE